MNKVYIEIDSDYNINKRFSKPLSKMIRKSILNTIIEKDNNDDVAYSLKLNINKSNIKVMIYANDGINIKHVCLVSTISKHCYSADAVTKLKECADNISNFDLFYNATTGCYFVSFPYIVRNFVNMDCECCICFEGGKKSDDNGFFVCNHKSICYDCYRKLHVQICPICRSI